MFLLKSWLGHLLMPLPLLGGLFLAGLVLSRRPAGRATAATAGLLLLALSLPPLPAALMRPLESRYPRLTDAQAAALARQQHIHWIVVLGAANGSDPSRPAASQLSAAGWRRLRAAVHLCRLMPDSRLLLSGGNPLGGLADATVMAAVAREMGVPATQMQLESQSRDTAEQARLLAPLLGPTPFLLVTSASHMPRAMALFEKRGLKPVAAPADFTLPRAAAARFWPDPANLEIATRAAHEYLGMLYARLAGLAD